MKMLFRPVGRPMLSSMILILVTASIIYITLTSVPVEGCHRRVEYHTYKKQPHKGWGWGWGWPKGHGQGHGGGGYGHGGGGGHGHGKGYGGGGHEKGYGGGHGHEKGGYGGGGGHGHEKGYGGGGGGYGHEKGYGGGGGHGHGHEKGYGGGGGGHGHEKGYGGGGGHGHEKGYGGGGGHGHGKGYGGGYGKGHGGGGHGGGYGKGHGGGGHGGGYGKGHGGGGYGHSHNDGGYESSPQHKGMKYKHANYEMTVYGDKNNHGQKDALNYEDGYASSYGNQKGYGFSGPYPNSEYSTPVGTAVDPSQNEVRINAEAADVANYVRNSKRTQANAQPTYLAAPILLDPLPLSSATIGAKRSSSEKELPEDGNFDMSLGFDEDLPCPFRRSEGFKNAVKAKKQKKMSSSFKGPMDFIDSGQENGKGEDS